MPWTRGQSVAGISQRVRAKRGPMTGSARCGTVVPRGMNPGFRSAHPGYADRVDSLFTMSNSAVFFVPAARCCARVWLLSFPSAPERGGRGAPEARTCGSPVTLARRDAASFRTRPSRATGTAPLGAPPWRFSGRATTAACHRQVRPAPRCGFPRPGLRLRPVGSRDLPRLAVRTAPSAGLPPPRSASERLRRRPSMSEDARYVAASRYEVNSVVEE